MMADKKTLESLFRKDCVFVAGAASPDAIPDSALPEFAFVGRSNVGKSSLLNALVFRKTLARVSQSPGCTRQINFFKLTDVAMLVDLPGYGYARVSKTEKSKWDNLIYSYLNGRQQLKKVFLLLDSRHEIKKSDIDTMTFLDDCAVQYQIILTKVDKISDGAAAQQIASLKNQSMKHSACHPEILAISSKTGIGMEAIRHIIAIG